MSILDWLRNARPTDSEGDCDRRPAPAAARLPVRRRCGRQRGLRGRGRTDSADRQRARFLTRGVRGRPDGVFRQALGLPPGTTIIRLDVVRLKPDTTYGQ